MYRYIPLCWINYIAIERGCYFVEQQEVISLGVLSLLLSVVRKQLAGNVLHVLCFLVFLVLIFESVYVKAHSPQCTKSQVDFHFSSPETFYESLDCLKNRFGST